MGDKVSKKKLSEEERLVIGQAIFAKIADEMSTKNPDGMRGRFNQRMADEWESTGYKSKTMMLNGKSVGSAWVNLAKAKPAATTKRLVVTDADMVAEYAYENTDDLLRYVKEHAQEVAEWFLHDSGSLADGAEVVEDTQPAEPEHVRSVTLKVVPEEVAEALKGQLPQAIAGLLEGGE